MKIYAIIFDVRIMGDLSVQYTAIAKDGGLFIPNINTFTPNQWVTLEVSKIEPYHQQEHQDYLYQVVGILKNVDGVEFQNSLREE